MSFYIFNTLETLVSNEPVNRSTNRTRWTDDANLPRHLLDQFMILGNLTRLLITVPVREGTTIIKRTQYLYWYWPISSNLIGLDTLTRCFWYLLFSACLSSISSQVTWPVSFSTPNFCLSPYDPALWFDDENRLIWSESNSSLASLAIHFTLLPFDWYIRPQISQK